MKQLEPRLFEYRIKYNAEDVQSAMDSYHYYMACTADQALSFHDHVMKRHRARAQNISIEKRNPWNGRWEDRSEVLSRHTTHYE